MSCGIYSITHRKTGWRYIGMSSNIVARWKAHLALLRSGRHTCRPLQDIYNHDGVTAFDFEIIEECEYDVIAEREAHYYRVFAEFNIWKVNIASQGYSDLGQSSGWGGNRPGTGQRVTPEPNMRRKTITLEPADLAHLKSVNSNLSAALREVIRRVRAREQSI